MLVSVSVTVPAVISAGEGVYCAVSVVLFGLKVPVPPLQAPPLAPPPTEPASVTVGLLEHTVWLPPALAVGAEFTVTLVVASAEVRPPTVTVQ